MLEVDKKKIYKFALNYRALIKNKWKPIYRINNFHGFLHEHKFWRSHDPKHLKNEEKLSINTIVNKYIDKIVKNFQKYRHYSEQQNKSKK